MTTPTVHITPPPLSPQSMADLLCTVMLLCRCKQPDGEAFWAYMCIKPSMAQSFKEARDKGNFRLEDFGTVIEWGGGEDAPDEVKKRMERDYGVNHQYEDQLLKAIELYKNRYSL